MIYAIACKYRVVGDSKYANGIAITHDDAANVVAIYDTHGKLVSHDRTETYKLVFENGAFNVKEQK